jgi:uncharacterized protein (TIGR02117 family)
MPLRRLLKKFLAGLGLFIAGYMLFALLVPKIPVSGNPDPEGNITVFILTNGVHTDIVVPRQNELHDWTPMVPPRHTLSGDTLDWIAFGWGDKGFYLETPTWADLKFSTAFRAAFWMGTAAIHATHYRSVAAGPRSRALQQNPAQYQALVDYITNSFQMATDGRPDHISTDAVYGKYDAFYEARGRYNLFYTCNSWANDVLRVADQRRALLAFRDVDIFSKYPQ